MLSLIEYRYDKKNYELQLKSAILDNFLLNALTSKICQNCFIYINISAMFHRLIDTYVSNYLSK